MFQDIFNILGQQGPNAWFDTATQLALNIARGDDGDPNPLPIERQRLEELAPLVGRHVDALFGAASDPVVTAVNRSSLTIAALAQWRPLIEPMLNTQPAPSTDVDVAQNPMMAQMAATNRVSRSRFFSTTDEPDSEDCMVPPNSDDRPPPLPRCSRINAISAKLVITSRICRKRIMSALLTSAVGQPEDRLDRVRRRV